MKTPTRERERERERVLALALALALSGCSALRPAPPPPIVRTDTLVVTMEVAPPLPKGDSVSICLSTGMTARVLVAANGDTLIGDTRVRVRDVRPVLSFAGAYAAEELWFASDTLRFEKRLYRKAGAQGRRVCDDLKLVGRFNGVPVFADVTAMGTLPQILLPVRPGTFQPYTTTVVPRRR